MNDSVKLSYPSKMRVGGKRVGTWDLQAGTTCPGSKVNGEVVEVCKSCYAKKGTYNFPVVKAKRAKNHEAVYYDEWVDKMVEAIGNAEYFRWFSSGDIPNSMTADKIRRVIGATPNTQHWLPTRSDQVANIAAILEQIEALPNVAVRRSANNKGILPDRPKVNSYVIREDEITSAREAGIYVCPTTLPGTEQKSCGDCTTCYTSMPVAYVEH